MKEYRLYISNINGYSGWLSSCHGTINLLGGFITPTISANKIDSIPLSESELRNIVKCLGYYGIKCDAFQD